MSEGPLLSVCIPAYNRPELLPPLLDSILSQPYQDCEIVIAEDHSPARPEIHEIVDRYLARGDRRIRYFENESTLGYDGNIRRLIEKAAGQYCLFMGNDDLLAPGALAAAASALERHSQIGVVLRSYASFDESPEKINQVFRYFETERFFPAGADTIVTFFRRCIVISGLVLHRAAALALGTNRFDGTLLYQLHLVGNILGRMNGVSLPQIIAYYRNGIPPDFGQSPAERAFVPKQHTPESSLAFMRGMFRIARDVQSEQHLPVYNGILRDTCNYSYPILSIQADKPRRIFIWYTYQLMKLGFWKSALFYAYFFALFLLKAKRTNRLIRWLKGRIGYTPMIGRIYQGTSVG